MGLKFQCQHCGKPIIAEFLSPGEQITCYHCGGSMEVPSSAEPTDEKRHVRPDKAESPWNCEKCNKVNIPSLNHCLYCGAERSKRPELDSMLQESSAVSKKNDQWSQSANPGLGAIDVLQMFAWIGLIAATIGGIWILYEFGHLGDYSKNPIGIAVGIAVLLEGMFSCALLLVIASIAESVIAIRKRMESNK